MRIDGMAADLLAASRSADLAQIVASRAAEALGGFGAYFGAVDLKRRVLQTRAIHGFNPCTAAPGELDLDGEIPASHVARTGRPLVIVGPTEYAAVFPDFWNQVGRHSKSRAFVYVPVLASGHTPATIGVLGVSFDQERQATADDVAVLEAVARFASRTIT